ncbi:MAG: hypothetical protein P1P93_06690 [Gammaproteobacteria bacterium]|nr:hypothetical protein [Gammaproteobacteria bacterium]
MTKFSLVIAWTVLLSATAITQAEVISITDPRYDVPNSVEGVTRPVQGMTMASVEKKFGQAVQKSAAVGEPPITRWTYPDFVVFFEHNLVIHSVVPH